MVYLKTSIGKSKFSPSSPSRRVLSDKDGDETSIPAPATSTSNLPTSLARSLGVQDTPWLGLLDSRSTVALNQGAPVIGNNTLPSTGDHETDVLLLSAC